MGNFEADGKKYHRDISRIEATEPVHANSMNARLQKMIDNTEFVKNEAESGDSKENTVTFTGNDSEEPDEWAEPELFQSGESHGSLFSKISTMFRNVRFLYRLLGSTDISSIGNGTVTEAISRLNTPMKGATASAGGKQGLVPAPGKGAQDEYLCGDGTWKIPYTHPASAAGAKTGGLYKITTDGNGHVTGVTAVTKADITGLGIPGQDTNTTYGAATQNQSGLMSADDKKKLDGVATGANAYTHPGSAAGAKTSGLYKITTDGNGHVTGVTAVTKADITGLGIPGQDTNTTYGAATQNQSGLMSADDKKKLDGVATGANAYTHPGSAAGAKTSGLYKITIDGNGHVTGASAVTKADITGLGIPGQDTNTTYGVATESSNGLMSAADKKLLSELNGNFEDVTSKFNWGAASNYFAYRIGKTVFFQARCTAKSASTMTFATIKESRLYPKTLKDLNAHFTSGSDANKNFLALATTDGKIQLTTYDVISGTVATVGDILVSGFWFIN